MQNDSSLFQALYNCLSRSVIVVAVVRLGFFVRTFVSFSCRCRRLSSFSILFFLAGRLFFREHSFARVLFPSKMYTMCCTSGLAIQLRRNSYAELIFAAAPKCQ